MSFIISTDSCSDLTKSFVKENNVHLIALKTICGTEERTLVFDSDKEFDKFYEGIASGEVPTTTQLNPFELKQYFEEILGKEPSGDIIHLSLSSGLSNTYKNAVFAAEEVNKLSERKIYVVDSLIATHGMAHLVEEMIKLRDSGMGAVKAVEKIKHIRDHQQGWVIVGDLFHLMRGGRISAAKATVGAVLGIKPIIVLAQNGKLEIESKARGAKKAVQYFLEKMAQHGFDGKEIWLVRTSMNEMYQDFKKQVIAKYPNVKIKERITGPVIGSHLGCGAVMMLFTGAQRLKIS
jgi:DegV family protein with EDD domain